MRKFETQCVSNSLYDGRVSELLKFANFAIRSILLMRGILPYNLDSA